MKSTLCILSFCGCLLIANLAPAQTPERLPSAGTFSDSLLLDYSLEDLLKLRNLYEQETEQLLILKDGLRQEGIIEMETLIENNPENPILDKILIRLAELYFEQELREYEYRMEAYISQSDRYADGAADSLPVEPTLDFGKSLALYQRIIDDFPASALLDDAYYNIGFLWQEMGEREQAAVIFESLARHYPESKFAPDALMRVAEYFFNPPVSDLPRAIEFYGRVLEHKEHPLYDAALYRLGWAYYRLNDYPQAIAYFTVLADDIERAGRLDPNQEYHFPAVKDEAVEYIGLSFLDYGGAKQAAAYFEAIGGREYGYDVFKKIGDAYMDVKEEYQPAIEAYEFLLAMYPYTPDAPYIQAKITEAQRRLDNTQLAYASRKQLFRKFRPGSEWWDKVSASDRKSAEILTERAMRENILYLLKTAETNNDMEMYRQAVADSREYLQAFPADSSSLQIHWNMALVLDTRLNQPDRAFEEYINISNLYPHSNLRKQAAENAIAIADENVRSDSLIAGLGRNGSQAPQRPDVLGRGAADEVQPQELTADEERLVFALDNYIKNFPHEPETERILAKAGGLYYEKRRFRQTIKYFKTLALHFPESEDLNYARYITMESYFGKGDFRSTELIAKHLHAKSALYSDRAETRLSEAIFLQAQAASDSSNHELAAHEFLRLVAETPDSKIADRALYNAGLEFDKIQDYEHAINTYVELTLNHPQSGHYLPALNNLAFDYREVGDFLNAGGTYERLARVDTNRSNAQVALYNASVSYVQAEAWSQAIEVNQSFVQRFPQAEEADDLLFDNAGYFLKLDSLEAANKIYADFTEKYPDSPRVIEAHLRRGEYFRDAGQPVAAKAQFEQAIARFEDFQARGLAPDDFLVAEALFQLAELKFVEYASIDFDLPSTRMAQNKAEKKALLLDLVESYSRVVGYGTLRLYEATFKIGRAYEEFAQTWAAQEIAETEADRRIVARNEINQTAGQLYEQAVAAYKDGAIALQKFAENNLQAVSEQDTTQKMDKVAADSSVQVAQNWIERCQNKISESLYQAAELKFAAVQQLMQAPVPDGMSRVEELVYRSQVLKQAVLPLARDVIAVHLRNLEESKELDMENAWVDSSRQDILKISRLAPDEMQKLSLEALEAYPELLAAYETMVQQDDEQALALATQLGALVAFGMQHTKAATEGLNESLAQGQTIGADSSFVAENETRMMQFVADVAARSDSLAKLADARRLHYETLLEQTDELRYEDATFTFDDLYFALSDGAHALWRLGFNISQQLEYPAQWSQKMAVALVMKSPEEYAQQFGLEFAEYALPSGKDWLVTSEHIANWQAPEMAETGWSQADSVGLATHVVGNDARAIWLPLTADTSDVSGLAEGAQDSLIAVNTDSAELQAAQESAPELAHTDTVYFRKSFDLIGLPVSGSIQVFQQAGYDLFLNGKRLAGRSLDAAEASPQTHDLSKFLREGKNVLAIAVADTGGEPPALETMIRVKSLANWAALLDGRLDVTDEAGQRDRTELAE